MTDKWQCSKCKELKIIDVSLDGKIDPTKREDVICRHEDIDKVKCNRVMRNLTEAVYLKEKSINDSGARD